MKHKMKTAFITAILIIISRSCVSCSLNKLVDLTWSFDNKTIYWTGVQPFAYTKKVENEERGYWYAAKEFCAGEHGGTHLDAPYHFNKYGWKVGHIPLEKLIAKGALIDLQNDTSIQGGRGVVNLEVKHLQKWEKDNGHFPKGSVLLIKFGRSQYWQNSNKYFDMDEHGKYNFPGVSESAAEWLANSGKFYGVGLDTPSVDPGRSTDFVAHRVLNGKQLYVLENVKLVEDLPAKDFTVLVMPMKLREGSGAPVRIVAVPKDLHF